MRTCLTSLALLTLALMLATPASAHFSQVFGRLKLDMALTTGSIVPDRGVCAGQTIDRLAPDWPVADL
ncbi:MAG: hypothetical protein P4L98_20135 [Ancalomicrobiaceae bacterium]|nr:hypothetical protein [Ancalomicrobiaceae bacterium]